MKKRIVIYGYGEIGNAIHYLLKRSPYHTNITCWDIDPDACPDRKPLDVIIPHADIIFLCIPSWAIRKAMKELKKHIRTKSVIVSLSKGLDRESGKTMDELIDDVFTSSHHVVLLNGPMLAEELLEGKLGAAVAASKSRKSRERIAELFNETKLRVSPIADMRGTALCGALKNIYSIGFGLAHALEPGENYKGLFVQMTLDEMASIVTTLGGKRETVLSHAGIGDLVATGFSELSKNHQYGETLARKGKVSFESEGAVSLKPMLKKIGSHKRKFKLLSTVSAIITRERPPKAILEL